MPRIPVRIVNVQGRKKEVNMKKLAIMTFKLIFTKNKRSCPQPLDFTGFLSTFH